MKFNISLILKKIIDVWSLFKLFQEFNGLVICKFPEGVLNNFLQAVEKKIMNTLITLDLLVI
jgi:hypothetical protein